MSRLQSKWDWYEATMDDLQDELVAPTLAAVLPGATLSRAKGRSGYAVGWAVERDSVVLAHVYERSARLGEVHVSTTSESCAEVVPVLRRLYPEHRVSRADSAVDFEADFDALDELVTAFAKQRGLSHRLFTNSDGGATRYVGSPSSEVQMRLYKKTEQLRSLHPEAAVSVPDGIVRFELVVRPGKREMKDVLGRVEPDDAWGFSQWSTDLAASILTISAERVSTHFRRPTDWSRALFYFGRQYGPMVQQRALEVGAAQVRAEILAALGVNELEGVF